MNKPGKLNRSTLLLWGFYAVLLVICLMLWVKVTQEDLGRFDTMAWDYINLYTGGSMALHGQGPAIYDLDAQIQWQAALLYPRHFTGGILPFRYAPTILPILIPFALAPLIPSYFLWLAGSAVVAVTCFLLLQAHLRLDRTQRLTLLLAFLSFYPLSHHLWQGQTALLVLLGFVLAYVAWRRGKEFWAGAALALCSIKPTLLLVPLVVLVVKGRWRTLAGFLVAAVGLTLPMLPLLGLRGTWDFVDMTIAGLGWNDVYGIFPSAMHNWRAFTLRLLGDGPAGVVLLAVLSLLSLIALLWTWQGPWEPNQPWFPRQVAVTVLLTTLVSPHLYLHDLVLWLLAGALIAYVDPLPRPRWLLFTLLLLGSAAPVASAAMPGPVGPPTVLVAAAVVVLLLLQPRKRETANA
jgi:alpha-1,2-mannosyltransferase